jgi:hypothetical protein
MPLLPVPSRSTETKPIHIVFDFLSLERVERGKRCFAGKGGGFELASLRSRAVTIWRCERIDSGEARVGSETGSSAEHDGNMADSMMVRKEGDGDTLMFSGSVVELSRDSVGVIAFEGGPGILRRVRVHVDRSSKLEVETEGRKARSTHVPPVPYGSIVALLDFYELHLRCTKSREAIVELSVQGRSDTRREREESCSRLSVLDDGSSLLEPALKLLEQNRQLGRRFVGDRS